MHCKLSIHVALVSAWAVGLAINPFPARSADLTKPLPVKAAVASTSLPAWSGFYIGAQVGYGADLTNANVAVGATTIDLGAIPRGPILGGQIGYDWSLATNLVTGLRVDLDYANMNATGNLGPIVSLNNATNYLGDADVRLGYTGFGNHVLLYVNGGFAFGGRKPNLAAIGMPTVAASDTSTGWNIGGGIETKLTEYVSTFGELDYYDLGSQSLTATVGGVPLVTSNTPFKFGIAKFGLNLHI